MGDVPVRRDLGGVRSYAALAAAGTTGALALWLASGDENVWDVVFAAVVFTGVLVVLRLAWRGWAGARTSRLEADAIRSVDPTDRALAAVAAERMRLAADIEAAVRHSVTEMVGRAAEARRDWLADPIPALRCVAAEGRAATQELRHMLGLLRDPPAPPPTARTSSNRSPRFSYLLAFGAAALAVSERWIYGELDYPAAPGPLILTALAAATIGFRGSYPTIGAFVCGLLFVGAVPLGGLSGGFWTLVTVGGLAWVNAAHRNLRGLVGFCALAIGTMIASAADDPPEVLPLAAALLLIAGLGGAFVGWSRLRRRRSVADTETRRAEIVAAEQQAVTVERLAVARDLHDLISHAVSVMIMQAGAAEVHRSRDPSAGLRAVDIIEETGTDALSELDRLVATIRGGTLADAPDSPTAPRRSEEDLQVLIARFRHAGLEVDADIDGRLTTSELTLAYRIVQEALTNTLRHAHATRSHVEVRHTSEALHVAVTDDGSGPNTESTPGFGLIGLRERLRREGGVLSAMAASADSGYRVQAWIPSPKNPSEGPPP